MARPPLPPASRRTRLTRTLVALTLVTGLTLAGCHSKDAASPSSSSQPADQPTAPGITVQGTWPLTGLEVKGAAPHHPVMVVKIDNSENSSPQVGLSHADLVTEELVEGGITRLAVFFYQDIPGRVGPVRSMRATDIGIVKPAKAVLVASGGAPPTIKRIKKAGIETFTEGAIGYQRDSSRQAPYNLFMDLSELAKHVRAKSVVPSYLPFGSAADLPAGKPASGLSAVFSGGHTTRWRYAGGTYTNLNSNAAAGDRFTPDTVLVLRVKVGNAGYLDPAGHTVPETHFTGTGKALLFHGGRVVTGTWKKTLDSTITLSSGGAKLDVPAGHTWIELVPKHGGRVQIDR